MTATLVSPSGLAVPNDQMSTTPLRSRAPLRISFAGGGTDVAPFPDRFGGAVLSATLDSYAYASLTPRTDGRVSLHSIDFDRSIHYGSGDPVKIDGDLDLVKAAVSRIGGTAGRGFDLLLQSSAPPGSGLGSSSTVMVALVSALCAHHGFSLSSYEIASFAHDLERRDLGIVGGKQDHYAAAFGGFNFIEFDGDEVLVNPLRVRPETVLELQHNLLLVYTGITRESGQIIEDQQTRMANGSPETLSGLHAQKRLAYDMKRALLKGRLSEFGHLLGEAWTEKKRFSPKISNPRIDLAYDVACAHGASGGKVTGAGGGGYILLYADFDRRHNVARALKSEGFDVGSIAFSSAGVVTWRQQ